MPFWGQVCSVTIVISAFSAEITACRNNGNDKGKTIRHSAIGGKAFTVKKYLRIPS